MGLGGLTQLHQAVKLREIVGIPANSLNFLHLWSHWGHHHNPRIRLVCPNEWPRVVAKEILVCDVPVLLYFY